MGRYSSREEADAAAVKASQVGAQPIVKQSGERYTVQLGSFSNRQNAESLAGKAGASIVPVQPQ
jgi:cell division protein FtsN